MEREYDDDASINIETLADYTLEPGPNIILSERVDWINKTDQALIIPRSSVFRRGMMIPTTLLDVGFVGPLRIFVFNMTSEKLYIPKGTKLVQIVPIERRPIDVKSSKGKRPYKNYPTDICPATKSRRSEES